MHKNRKLAKMYIEHALKPEYDLITTKAFLTVRQARILLLKRTDPELSNWKISNIIHVSVDTVNHEFLKIYDKIAKAMLL